MRLEDLGYLPNFEKFRTDNNLTGFETGRITEEHKERYIVRTEKGEFEAEITGNMRFTAKSREDFPAVGDWVSVMTYDSGSALIHKIFPRFSVIKRQAIGQFGEVQIMATNIDFAFVVQSVGRDFNMNRIERYLTICNASLVNPIIVITKIDLVDETGISGILENIKSRMKDIPVIAISNESLKGIETLKSMIEKGKTYCILGSSGVGKSTLVNNLYGKEIMRTDSISQSTNKGRHVTSHRELTLLENGGILIDNPGMREVGITETSDGLSLTFDSISRLSRTCRFKDCSHINETGCSVREAVEKGEISKASYENYLKLAREKEHYESTVAEIHRKDKEFGKLMKNYKKELRKNK